VSLALRWPLWINGGDWIASTILFFIFYLSCAAILHLFIRLFCNACIGSTCLNIAADAKWHLSSAPPPTSTPSGGSPTASTPPAAISLTKERAGELVQAQWDARRWFANWLEGAIPALGFVGTIVGLGEAFGSVGIISQIEVVQRQALMGVLLDLGTAFSTTFWALIWSGLVVVPLNALVCSLEDRALAKAVT
jgi:hypothetical protein